MTRALVDRVNSKRDLLISTTSMGEKIFVRVAVMSARTTSTIVKELLTRIREGVHEVSEYGPHKINP